MKTLVSLIVGTLLVSSLAMAGHGRHGGHMKKILKQLNLTDEQKDQIKTFRQSRKGSKKELRSKMKELKSEMKSLYTSDASDSTLKSKHLEIKGIKSQFSDMRFERMLKIRSILTKEQRVKFQELKEKRRKERKDRRSGRDK